MANAQNGARTLLRERMIISKHEKKMFIIFFNFIMITFICYILHVPIILVSAYIFLFGAVLIVIAVDNAFGEVQ